jgi:branched-chain amino acid transport system permease protein
LAGRSSLWDISALVKRITWFLRRHGALSLLALVVLVLIAREVRDKGWDVFWQLFVGGVTLGSVYALIALGYSLVYGILKLLNFAHGDVYMIGAFLGYGMITAFGGPAGLSISVWLLLIAMFAVSMVGTGFLGVVIERFAYRPLRNAPRIAPLISALGVSFFLQNSALLLFGAAFRSYDSYNLGSDNPGLGLPGPLFTTVFSLKTVPVSRATLIVVVGGLLLMLALTTLVGRTRLGKAMRATAYDREAASMMGIDTDRVIASTFFIGSALAGAAGVMYGLVFSQIFHFMGFLAGLKGFTAAVVGGIGSIPGAMVGGLLVGLAETFAAGYVSGNWANLIVFAMLIVVMLVRPSGLFGTRAIQKV